jgi:hypothetical protein
VTDGANAVSLGRQVPASLASCKFLQLNTKQASALHVGYTETHMQESYFFACRPQMTGDRAPGASGPSSRADPGAVPAAE